MRADHAILAEGDLVAARLQNRRVVLERPGQSHLEERRGPGPEDALGGIEREAENIFCVRALAEPENND